MPAALIALAAAGGIMSAIGTIEESEARAEQARRDAALKKLQADEVLARADINAGLMARQGQRMESSQAAQYGTFNVDLGASQYGVMRETFRSVDESIQLMKREAEFRAKMLREGANSSDALANDMENAGYWNAAASLLGAGASTANAAGAFDKKPSAPRID